MLSTDVVLPSNVSFCSWTNVKSTLWPVARPRPGAGWGLRRSWSSHYPRPPPALVQPDRARQRFVDGGSYETDITENCTKKILKLTTTLSKWKVTFWLCICPPDVVIFCEKPALALASVELLVTKLRGTGNFTRKFGAANRRVFWQIASSFCFTERARERQGSIPLVEAGRSHARTSRMSTTPVTEFTFQPKPPKPRLICMYLAKNLYKYIIYLNNARKERIIIFTIWTGLLWL